MLVLEAEVSQQSYEVDYDRVEASVSLIVKTRMGQPAHRMRVRTNQPLRGDRPLEERLIEDAIVLARAMVPATRAENLYLAA